MYIKVIRQNKLIFKRIIAILLSGIFLLDQTLSFSEPVKSVRKTFVGNLSAANRFNSPVTLVWDEKKECFEFKNGDALEEKFSFEGKIALMSHLLGQFLLRQKEFYNRDINVSTELLEKKYDDFLNKLIALKKTGNKNFEPFYFKLTENGHGLRFCGSNAQISFRNPQDGKLYYLFVSLSDKIPSLGKGNAACLPLTKENTYVTYEIFGPFDELIDDYNPFAPGFVNSLIYRSLHYTVISRGSEMKLVWGRDINAWSVVNFYRYLAITSLDDDAREAYFYSLLTNIFASTYNVKDRELIRALDMVIMSEEDGTIDKIVVGVKFFCYLCEKNGITQKDLLKLKTILDEIEDTAKKEDIKIAYLDSFDFVWDIVMRVTLYESEKADFRRVENNAMRKIEERFAGDLKRNADSAQNIFNGISSVTDKIKDESSAKGAWTKIAEREWAVYKSTMFYKPSELYVFEEMLDNYVTRREANPVVDRNLYSYQLFTLAAMFKLEKNDYAEGKRLLVKASRKLDQSGKTSAEAEVIFAKSQLHYLMAKVCAYERDYEKAQQFCKEAITTLARLVNNSNKERNQIIPEYLIEMVFFDAELLLSLGKWEDAKAEAAHLLFLLNFGANVDCLSFDERRQVISGFKVFLDAYLKGYREYGDRDEMGEKARMYVCKAKACDEDGKARSNVLNIYNIWSFVVDDDLDKASEEFLKLENIDMPLTINDAVTFIRIAKLLAQYCIEKGEKDKAQEIVDLAKTKIKDNENSFPEKVDILFETLPDQKVSRRKRITDIRGMLGGLEKENVVTSAERMALIFMEMEQDFSDNGQNVIFDKDGELKDHARSIIDLCSGNETGVEIYKLLELEYRWHTKNERERFLETLKRIFDSPIPSLAARLEILHFLVYVEEGDDMDLEFFYQAEKTLKPIFCEKGDKKKTPAERARELLKVITQKLSKEEALELAKNYLSKGEMAEVLVTVKAVFEGYNGKFDDSSEKILVTCHECARLFIEAKSYYEELNFEKASESVKSSIGVAMFLCELEYKDEKLIYKGTAGDGNSQMRDINIFRGYCKNTKAECDNIQKLFDAEKSYKSGDYDGAIRLTKEVDDKPARAFLKKVQRVAAAARSKNPEKELAPLLGKYPGDGRIKELLDEIDRQKELEKVAGNSLAHVNALLKRSTITKEEVISISQAITRSFCDVGFTNTAFDVLIRACDKFVNCGLYDEATGLLDASEKYITDENKRKQLCSRKSGIEAKRSQAYREQKKKDALARLVALETTISRNDLKEKDFDRVLKGIKEAVIDIGCDPLPLRIFMRAIKKA
ncbi:MAG: hypothetical protein PHW46_04715, partial [Candidatus Omnitrophica bacterium]|nr:hypothetical protein [Candidatus Omnitrophota bacterium]